MKVRVASAGTGKTTSLVLRYLELINDGTALRRIAGVTFTRKSAHELRQRVNEGIKELLENGEYLAFRLDSENREKFLEAKRELEGASLSTIHGFMANCLRLVAPIMGLDPDFSILGEWEAEAIFEEEMRSLLYLAKEPNHALHLAGKTYKIEEKVLELFRKRSLSQEFICDDNIENVVLREVYERSYAAFSMRFKSQLLSPAEIERQAILLTNTKPALERLSKRYKLLLIDEYQDLNPLQGEFFEKLEAFGINIEVVGDPKQSIYGFRNADVGVFRKALRNGEVLEPLHKSYRHSKIINRLLNKYTATMAKNNMGFSELEAPKIESNRSETGFIEINWVVGNEPIDDLRLYEAQQMAKSLQRAHQLKGIDYSDMAVLARSNKGLKIIENALKELELPNVLLQGRGYYDRIEIRDIYNALKLGIDAGGVSLAAWLRSPFAALKLTEIDKILSSEKPLLELKQYPQVYSRLEKIRKVVKGNPIDALKFLIREPFIGKKRYIDFLDKKARENLDALIFTMAQQAPGEIEFLLDRLEHLSLQTDAGDVPQSGQGIQLLTIHSSKGLEWPLVAVFDIGRNIYHRPQDIFLDADSGQFALKGTDSYAELQMKQKAKAEQEDYRLLYVALSRAKDILLLSGSIKNSKTASWTKALQLVGIGADAGQRQTDDFVLKVFEYQKLGKRSAVEDEKEDIIASAWIDKEFGRPKYPAVISPSYLKKQSYENEPAILPEQEQGEYIPGLATTIGTLTHDAISQNWRYDNDKQMAALRAQELMFPFSEAEKDTIMESVRAMLKNHSEMLGKTIPSLEVRNQDFAELPMVLPVNNTVIQGIIDRLYQVDNVWYLEDYKTDKVIKPEHYHLQLALYYDAVKKVLHIEPIVQLVYLRESKVIVLDKDLLEPILADNIKQLS